MPEIRTHESSRQRVRRRLVGGAFWALVGKGGTLGLNFVLMALVTRLLDPAAAGAYLLSQVLVNAAALGARLGLEQTVIFRVSSALGDDEPGRALGAIRRVLGLGIASAALVGTALTFGGAAWIGERVLGSALVARVAPMLGPWAAALALQILLSETFRGFHAIREAALFGGVVSGTLTLLGFGVLRLQGPLSLEAAVGTAAASVAASAVIAGATLFARLQPMAANSAPEPVASRTILRDALPVLGSNATAFVILNVDVWVVGAYLPEREVAVYAATVRLATLISLGAVIGNQVLPPLIGELHAKGERGLMERALRGVAFVVSVPAVAAALLFVLAGPLVLRLAFGPFYEAGADILRVLSVGQLACVVTGSTAFALLMTGHQVASLWLSVGGAVSATVGSLLAVGHGGGLGVAKAIAGVLVVQQLVTLVTARRLVGVWTHASPRAVGAELRGMWARLKGSGATDAR
jgi:O-antigen/teichoic acid export membrane protein